ncbi:translation initiation factor IF-2, chloroplastic-like [Papaver somniferum]|uniref:translation initiation factor IF-2, chloroplastic-like n=1 Tax=Papaver somniferum TaxID=3469 RepID=UPI000E6F9DFE|nr:translation initiation factor IF-2, chloroplastic-like [Papaver somniferum]
MITFAATSSFLKHSRIACCFIPHCCVNTFHNCIHFVYICLISHVLLQVLGFSSVPTAGDEFEVVDSLDTAREMAETRAVSLRDERISSKVGDGMVTLSSLAAAVSAGKQAGIDLHKLNVVMKVDLQGSIEAIRQALQVLPQDNVTLKFLLQATGDISASDVDLVVAAGKAIIIGFNVKVPNAVKSHADNKGVEIRLYRVIYELIDDMRKAMEGLLDPVEEQIPIGAADIRAVFSSGSGRVAGCMITDGKIVKSCGIRILRNGKTIHVGVVDSLRRVKEVVKEIKPFIYLMSSISIKKIGFENAQGRQGKRLNKVPTKERSAGSTLNKLPTNRGRHGFRMLNTPIDYRPEGSLMKNTPIILGQNFTVDMENFPTLPAIIWSAWT